MKCRIYDAKFYFNNKLYKHLRSEQHRQTQKTIIKIEKITKRVKEYDEIEEKFYKEETIQEKFYAVEDHKISIVISTRNHKNHKEYAFRNHQYVRIKESFDSTDHSHDFCADSETFMFLIDRKFLTRLNTQIERTDAKLEVRDIEFKTHDIFEYCHLDLYFHERFKNELKIAHIREEFHLVNNLDVNMLINIDIIRSEECILNFKIKNMIFSSCNDIEVLITIVRTN